MQPCILITAFIIITMNHTPVLLLSITRTARLHQRVVISMANLMEYLKHGLQTDNLNQNVFIKTETKPEKVTAGTKMARSAMNIISIPQPGLLKANAPTGTQAEKSGRKLNTITARKLK